MDYNVTMNQFRITDIKIHVDFRDHGSGRLSARFNYNISEPRDPQNATVLLEIQVTCEDDAHSLQASCSAFAIMGITPVPDNWKEAVAKNCLTLVQEKIISHIQKILSDMEQPISIKEP